MTKPFVRDRFTWLAYFMLGYYAYSQSIMGPIMPYLRDELGISYTVGGLHLSAFAIGMILSGTIGDKLIARFGRSFIFWGGGFGMAAGATLLAAGQTPVITIASSGVMGFCGTLTLIVLQAALNTHHGERGATALTEANVMASAAATLNPLLVGFGASLLVNSTAGWRLGLIAAIVTWFVLRFFGQRITIPVVMMNPDTEAIPVKQARLPVAFWVYWVVMVIGVSIEWCVVFWGADFMDMVVGIPRETAVTLMSVFFVAMIVGRFAGSRLTLRYRPGLLIFGAIACVGVGFPMLWLAQIEWLTIVGLFLVGLGVANFFPLVLAIATRIASEQSDAASARITLAAGIAVLAAPLVLGNVADQVGLKDAFAIIAVLIGLMLAATVVAERMRHQT